MDTPLNPTRGTDSPISFPNWREVLGSDVPDSTRRSAFEADINEFLFFCRQHHAAATIGLAKYYLGRPHLSAVARRREALRWFVRHAPLVPHNDRPRAETDPHRADSPGAARLGAKLAPPPTARSDLGGADWERDLISAVRRKGFLWRTEQTYRAWAARFAKHLLPRSPYAAAGDDVAAFLSKLAVEQRASAATQKQAA